MKPVTSIAVALALLSASGAMAKDRTSKVIKTDGGPDGFETVVEYHGTAESTLDCCDPGFEPCIWLLDSDHLPRLTGYAEQKITEGVLSGSYWEIQGSTKYTITWTALDAYNACITETEEYLGGMN